MSAEFVIGGHGDRAPHAGRRQAASSGGMEALLPAATHGVQPATRRQNGTVARPNTARLVRAG